ncbi:unnamed protein product, partial [Iphiclides podalirius]
MPLKYSELNNYYVIEMPEDAPPTRAQPQQKTFSVYWNVPTMQCRSKRIPFSGLYERYGIIQNAEDRFRGEKISILYDPGLFPALLKNESSGKLRFRNGGVPQEGNINEHLEAFRLTMEQSIPDVDFAGVGIIDFESWRPVFRQNFGVLTPYKDVSYDIERKLHWWWPKTWIQDEARKRYEEAARVFMETTISLAKQMRPKALWGYYGFPYCFNMAANNPLEKCSANVMKENNQIQWLWSESSALYPSVYSSSSLSAKQLAALVRGRVAEAARVGSSGPVLPYFWFRYRDGGFLSEIDLQTVLKTLYKSNASGFIIWGSSNDVNTVDKCNKLLSYVENTLGPAIAKYVKSSPRFDDGTTAASFGTGIASTESSSERYNYTGDVSLDSTSTTSQTTPDNLENEEETSSSRAEDVETSYQFVPYNNHTVRTVEEVSKRSTPRGDEHTSSSNGNAVIDMLMNALAYTKTPVDETSNGVVSTEKYFHHFYTTAPAFNLTSTSKEIANTMSTSSPILNGTGETKEGLTLYDIVLNGNEQTTKETSPLSTQSDSIDVLESSTAVNNLSGTNENTKSDLLKETTYRQFDFSTVAGSTTDVQGRDGATEDIDDFIAPSEVQSTTDSLTEDYTDTEVVEMSTEFINFDLTNKTDATTDYYNTDSNTNAETEFMGIINDTDVTSTAYIEGSNTGTEFVGDNTQTLDSSLYTSEPSTDASQDYSANVSNTWVTNDDDFSLSLIVDEDGKTEESSQQTDQSDTAESIDATTDALVSELLDITDFSAFEMQDTSQKEEKETEGTTEDAPSSLPISPDKVVVYIL